MAHIRDKLKSVRSPDLVSAAIDVPTDKISGRIFRLAVESCPSGMLVADSSGTIVLVNAEIEQQFGYRREELIGQSVDMLVPARVRGQHARHRDEFSCQPETRRVRAARDLLGVRKDGTEFPVEVALNPIRTRESLLILSVIVDISERKKTEKKLAEADKRRFHLAAIVDSSDDAILTKALDGTILSWNKSAERVYGYSAAEIVGKPISVLVPTDRPGEVEDILERIKQCTAVDHFEAVRVHKNGRLIPMSLTISPIKNADGKVIAASTIGRDISGRKAAEATLLQKVAELNRSNEELEQFAYIASHDLQEPLRMVASYTQLLSRKYKGKLDTDADEFIAFAVDGASRMQRLIQDMLAYSRVNSTGQELVETSSDHALQQALANLRGAIEESGALVTHDALPAVRADARQLAQLFQNLVGNAIKYQNPGIPKIHVSAAKDGETKWIFSVRDNGIGIDSQYSEKIFGMFQRLHKREEYAGTGIGLAICKKIVERHGGSISVESQPGHGSTFRFVLAGSERTQSAASKETVCP